MPKILFLADGLENGGAQRQLALLVKYLPPEWDCRVWSLGGGPFAQIIKDTNAVVLDVHPRIGRLDITPTLHLWRTVIRWRPDVIHTWGGWMAASMALPVAKFLRIPIVNWGIRNATVYQPRRGIFKRWSMGLSDRVVANSQAGLMAWGIDPQRGRVIYNGFDPDRLALSNHSEKISSTPTTVIMTGRMTRHKDYPTFLAAARKLALEKPAEWRFIALGDGLERSTLLLEVSDLVASEQMIFPDKTVEVMGWVSKSDVGVLLSNPSYHAEGCSNSIMEYMVCGLPVVCSDSGGNRELVLDGKTGWVIPPADVNALVEKLFWLQANPGLAQQMGEAGRQRILSDFSVATMVRNTLHLYEELLQQ